MSCWYTARRAIGDNHVRGRAGLPGGRRCTGSPSSAGRAAPGSWGAFPPSWKLDDSAPTLLAYFSAQNQYLSPGSRWRFVFPTAQCATIELIRFSNLAPLSLCPSIPGGGGCSLLGLPPTSWRFFCALSAARFTAAIKASASKSLGSVCRLEIGSRLIHPSFSLPRSPLVIAQQNGFPRLRRPN